MGGLVEAVVAQVRRDFFNSGWILLYIFAKSEAVLLHTILSNFASSVLPSCNIVRCVSCKHIRMYSTCASRVPAGRSASTHNNHRSEVSRPICELRSGAGSYGVSDAFRDLQGISARISSYVEYLEY